MYLLRVLFQPLKLLFFVCAVSFSHKNYFFLVFNFVVFWQYHYETYLAHIIYSDHDKTLRHAF